MREWGEPLAAPEEVERDDRRMSVLALGGYALLLINAIGLLTGWIVPGLR